MKLLILESSTTSAKAMLYDAESDTWRIVTKPYGFAHDSNGTHDGEAVFLKTAQAAKEIADGIQVDIILQSTTWHSLALTDKDGALLSPVELWSYTGANELCKRLRENGFEKNYYRKTGCLI
ncbi:MAG: FGGY family carbohydrate kinase, partial [Treponema socranskii subsp. buccale]